MGRVLLLLIVAYTNSFSVFPQKVNCVNVESNIDEIIGVPECPAKILNDNELENEFNNFEFGINIPFNKSFKGRVYTELLIDELGNVKCFKIIKSFGEDLDKKAKQIIEKAKFIPATTRGKRVTSHMILPITFGGSLKKKKEKK